MISTASPNASIHTAKLPVFESAKVVLVIDLVESVRLMSLDEPAVIGQWQGFVQYAEAKVLPVHGGRMVKSLGDGMLVEFEQCASAVQAALALQTYFSPHNATAEPQLRMYLRAGLHVTHLYRDEHDVYGHGVNLAPRVASLADPGETVVTAAVRDSIVDGVDGEVEDMGESYLKHWPEPVRTWRVHPVSKTPAAWRSERPEAPPTDFRPSIAVIPFEARNPEPEHFVIGELIADGVITQLARSRSLRVISRLSTTGFRGREAKMEAIKTHLDVGFILGGGYSVLGDRVMITAELSDTRSQELVWADQISGPIADLMQPQSQLVLALTDAASQALIDHTVQHSLTLPLPQLDSNSLLLGGIALMHRSTTRDLDRSRELLDAVTYRHKRVATTWAWLAKWHILNIVQGRSADAPREFRQAIDISDRALDLEPHSSLALAIKGHVQCHLGTDLDTSRQLLLQATEANPNDANAWLYAGFWSTMWGDPNEAVSESERALALSPLDPQRFFIEMLVAHSYLAANNLEKTIETCQRSLRRNRYYLATLRVLMTAQFESGLEQEAKASLNALRASQPNLTLSHFLSYGQKSPVRQRVGKAMGALGLP
jgi:adenylate cyclase